MPTILNFIKPSLFQQCRPILLGYEETIRPTFLHGDYIRYDFATGLGDAAIHLRWPMARSCLILNEREDQLELEHVFIHSSGKRTSILKRFDSAAEALREIDAAMLTFLTQFDADRCDHGSDYRLPVVRA